MATLNGREVEWVDRGGGMHVLRTPGRMAVDASIYTAPKFNAYIWYATTDDGFERTLDAAKAAVEKALGVVR